ncbi:hypothetical protein B0I35DRAFT_364904 [Stachybotrys elegans]|uniref:Saccharopine dehydrogenase NADP binding domain-containing protein n=1 Tax=Stachybotrys elegans TaxID=80388 RepID=A0A8K0WJ20_9HYPO|nr:hypothetical protein B0I35DRAFT_364904 [Stachybotrys elegans]
MLLIYGATGYTGRLACQHAKDSNLTFQIAGRTQSTLQELSASLGIPHRVFDLQNIADNLRDVSVLLNCAGPFPVTAGPLVDACMSSGVHYLDISADIDSYRTVELKNEDAKRAGVMLLPGCGGSVAMLGCLTAYVVEHARSVKSIDVALRISGSMSRGSALSAARSVTAQVLNRVDGELVQADTGNTCNFDFDNDEGMVSCFPVTLPDLITLYHSTGVRNIRAFLHVAGNVLPSGDLSGMPDGPDTEERDANPYVASAVVEDEDGIGKRGVLHMVNGYTFTAIASVEAAKRVLAGKAEPGFQTPVQMFGGRFVESVPGSQLSMM